MSAAAAPAGAAVPAKKGKKMLIIIVAVVLLVVIGGAAALLLLKKKAPAGEDGDETVATASAGHGDKPDLKHPPTFLPIDPFVVNLSDKDADRYAQIGITFEVEDAKFAESMKAFMPAIRNGILMILSHKTSTELLDRAGKEALSGEILRESARTMGIEVDEPAPEVAKKSGDDKAEADDEDAPKTKKKKRKAATEPNPIKHVHFSNFIVQ